MIMEELSVNKSLLKMGDGNSSEGSDSAPSEDNLNPAELIKNLPVVDKDSKKKAKDKKLNKKEPASALLKKPELKRVPSQSKEAVKPVKRENVQG